MNAHCAYCDEPIFDGGVSLFGESLHAECADKLQGEYDEAYDAGEDDGDSYFEQINSAMGCV